MEWNHRVVKRFNQDGTEFYRLEETFYGEEGLVDSSGQACLVAEDAESLKWTIQMMLDSFNHPVLTITNAPVQHPDEEI